MNAITGKLTGDEKLDVCLANFYQLRSEMLDSFADIERSVLTYVLNNNKKGICSTAPLGQKIEAAKKVPAGPRRSKKLKSKPDEELNKLADLLHLRAGVVHSRMEMAVTTGSNFIAIFRNTKDAVSKHPEALVYDFDELRRFIEEVKELANSLTEALTAQNPIPKPKT